MRAQLLMGLEHWLEKSRMTQAEAAKVLGVTQARVSDLKRGKIDRFSMDLLVRLAAARRTQAQAETRSVRRQCSGAVRPRHIAARGTDPATTSVCFLSPSGRPIELFRKPLLPISRRSTHAFHPRAGYSATMRHKALTPGEPKAASRLAPACVTRRGAPEIIREQNTPFGPSSSTLVAHPSRRVGDGRDLDRPDDRRALRRCDGAH